MYALKREAVFTVGVPMIAKIFTKNRLRNAVFGCVFAIIGLMTGAAVATVEPVYAVPETTTAAETEDIETEDIDAVTEAVNEGGSSCKDSMGKVGWLICPITETISNAVDFLYDKIETILVVNPVEMKDGAPIYEIWKYMRGITNIVFIIFLLVMVYSQLTGLGITNYGLKKILPKLIVAAILVNLSFVICSLAVDVSNIIGDSLRGVFTSIEEATMGSMSMTGGVKLTDVYSALAGGSILAVGVIAFEPGVIWMLIPTVLGAIVSVVIGLVTIALRQAVVALLIMISPLAIVAYMLPNTEQWFKKWRQLLTKMLVFYPMFSLLFGASSLAGWAIIASAKDGFMMLLGIAVQIFPLFFAWSLMKMSGTVLGTINSKLNGIMARPLAANRSWAESHRDLTKAKRLASGRVYTPSLALMQYMSNRKIAREEETSEHNATIKNRGLAYGAMRNYKDKDGKVLSREGEEAFDATIRNIKYGRVVDRHKNNFEEGVGGLSGGDARLKARLDILDRRIIAESDLAAAEKARGEFIAYRNADGRHKRMEDAINAHFDERGRGNAQYKMHAISDRVGALERYDAVKEIVNGSEQNTQYVAAAAAAAYDTQKKIVESKMQKYFELTPPTKDVEYRLAEFTTNKNAAQNIDAIVAGLRVLNQRGDTDLVKAQLDNIINKDLGGGITLGTHASQSLASFLMFEVKDNDPFLRRFGKYINLETARVYNQNERKVESVTYDEYVKGYHDGEPDLVTAENPTGRMYAKKGMKQLVEGTSLDNVERTAFANLDDSLKKAYGYDSNNKSKPWDVDGWLRKREEIQTAFEPAFLSASLKWLSGSEQINSGVKFWTGYELKQKKNENGVVMTDENGNPEYDLSPVWKEKEFAGHEDEVEKYFRRKTSDYFKDQTTGQILGMRTDYRDPTMEHLVESYLSDSSDGESSEERRREYEARRAEIQSRYGDEDANVAQKKRNADLKKLKMEMAGTQLRKILDSTGKLEQIYNTRRSGAANNAKDWLRKMLNLDDKDEIYRYLDRKNKKRTNEGGESQVSGDSPAPVNVYSDPVFRTRVMTELNDIFDKSGDSGNSDEDFYDKSLNKIVSEFGEDNIVVANYKKFREDNPHADRSELWDKLEETLSEFFSSND